MLLAGLTGGLATGKSHVGHELAGLGCHLIKADDLGHQVLAQGQDGYRATVEEFGPEILDANGNINRRTLASLVFNSPQRLQTLNGIVHPLVRARTQALVDEFRAADPGGVIVVEAAILIETGSYRNYDRLILVICSEEQQIERAMHRDGITREEALARLRMQLPLAEKIKFANFVIDTSGSKEDTAVQTRAVFDALRSSQK